MSVCRVCVPWNMPCALHQQLVAGATGALVHVPLRFHEWITYHLHIVHHQGPVYWGGELDGLTALFREDPSFRLDSVPAQMAA